MLEINIKTIPHKEQRYETVGDYFVAPEKPGAVEVRISELSDWRYEFLILIHELIEAYLCKYRGVSFEAIDAFDKAFEASRQSGDTREPGNDLHAPYFNEHQFATIVEMMVAQKLGVEWPIYDKEVSTL